MKYGLIITALLLLVSAAVADEPAAAPPAPAANDSLLVIPQAVDAPHAGDLQRSSLEVSVFRREQPVEYASSGRRDPFRPLIVDEKKTGVEIETELLQMDGALLTGVVWSSGQYLALVKDKDGRNFFLRDGDPIFQGHVTLVTQSTATFEISDFGDYQKVVLKVRVKGKDKERDKG